MSLSGSEAVEKTTSLWLIVAVGLLGIALSYVPFLGLLFYPVRLFVTFLHEASHGLAAIVTGGQLLQFTLAPDTSGLAYTRGGFRPLILVAGYAGSCLWGGLLLVASRRAGWEKAVLLSLGAFLLGFTVLFVRNFFGFGVGLGLGAFFLWAGWHGHKRYLSLLLAFLAVQNSFFALEDLVSLFRISAGTRVVTDASLMSRELTAGLVPPVVFAVGIGLLAIATFLAFLWLAVAPERAMIKGAGRDERMVS